MGPLIRDIKNRSVPSTGGWYIPCTRLRVMNMPPLRHLDHWEVVMPGESSFAMPCAWDQQITEGQWGGKKQGDKGMGKHREN